MGKTAPARGRATMRAPRPRSGAFGVPAKWPRGARGAAPSKYMNPPAYVHGASDVPLLGETIGDNLKRTVARVGAQEALVAPAQNYRATYTELWDATTALAARSSR